MHTERLGELARRQGGVFARWQAYELGFTRFMIARRLATKEWLRVLGNVFISSTSHLDHGSGAWAATLACGPGAVLSGPSAMAWHGLDLDLPDGPIHWVTVPPERHVRVARVRTIREALPGEDVTVIAGMPVTTVARSVVDSLRVLPERSGRDVLDRALLRSWLTVEELETRAHGFTGRRGVGRLRYHLTRVRGGARSEAERLLHEVLERGGFSGWSADFKVFDQDGVLLAVLDVAFAKQRLALEVDGLAFHTDPERFQRDRTRQNRLVNQGWLVLRFTWDDLTHRPRHVIETVRSALAIRQDLTPRSESKENFTG
jgi:very-short-patch-repair endonuclease